MTKIVLGTADIYFNPRSHEGSDRTCEPIRSHPARFQSTLPRGERQDEKGILPRNGEFQSTLPRGERRYGGMTNAKSERFQSTLPRGERPDRPITKWDRLVISIHAPTRGATVFALDIMKDFDISIHAPTRGATVRSGGSSFF